jgi:DNA-binding NarL/FixJ family response regulator
MSMMTPYHTPIEPDSVRNLVPTFPLADPAQTPDYALTPNEIRILRMLAEGESYQEVARQRRISVNTVRNYIRSIYYKLAVHTKTEAVSKAMRGGLIT